MRLKYYNERAVCVSIALNYIRFVLFYLPYKIKFRFKNVGEDITAENIYSIITNAKHISLQSNKRTKPFCKYYSDERDNFQD